MVRQILICLSASVVLYADSSAMTLSEAYHRALVYEAKLRSVAYQVDAKKEDVKQAESQLYPQIFASFDNSNRNYTTNYYERNGKEKYNSASITASQVIYHPEIIAQIESADLKVDSAKIYLTKQEQELAYKVADAYISILKNQNAVAVANSYVQTNFVKYQQISEKLNLALANKMDFLESKLSYEQAKITLHKQENLLALSKVKLKNLTGIDVESIPSVDFDTLEIDNLLNISSLGGLENNPDIKMAELGTKIYEKEIEAAKYGHYPKLDLSLSHTKYNTDSYTVDYERETRVMLEFRIPIFQGGRISSEIEKNRVMLNSAKEDLSDQQREVKIKYEELILNYKAAIKDIALQKDAENSAELYLSAVQKGHDHGLKSLIDLEDAKSKLYETKFKLIDSIYTLINSYVGILNITGKLTPYDIEKLNAVIFKTS
ncbi:Outer membrane protein TolC [Sulfurospirillum diekertiae]|uniref:Outer membrane protein TolC n=1 Tax=Sulfurospirillum diekertiae TaxID=1854492 RepID=A0A290HHC2_9BACT|nr:TolC family protein [Sulfurospirillum diekertiae]ATB70952.1 Outer membrane protein TolC [Sulfurospirillum diekertiae]